MAGIELPFEPLFFGIKVMFGQALLFLIIGFALHAKQKSKAAKAFYILAGVYLLVSLGICGALVGGF